MGHLNMLTFLNEMHIKYTVSSFAVAVAKPPSTVNSQARSIRFITLIKCKTRKDLPFLRC